MANITKVLNFGNVPNLKRYRLRSQRYRLGFKRYRLRSQRYRLRFKRYRLGFKRYRLRSQRYRLAKTILNLFSHDYSFKMGWK